MILATLYLLQNANNNANMLTKDTSLTKVRDFNLILKYGRWSNGQFLDIKVLKLATIINYFPKKEDPDKFKNQLKIAITVGLKISKRAVKRNRLKRQLREIVRLLIKENKIKSGHYIMVIAKKGSLDRNYPQLSEELTLLLMRSKVLDFTNGLRAHE